MTLIAKLKPILVALLFGVSIAHAEVKTFRIFGTVDQSLPMALVGSKVTGTFSYDTSTAPLYTIGEASGSGYGQSSYFIQAKFELKVNAHTISSDAFYVEVVNNGGGNVEDLISVTGNPMTVNGTFFREGLFGFQLATRPGKKHVLRSTELPSKLIVQQFDADASQNYGWVMTDGSGNGTLVSFKIDRIMHNPSGND